MVKALRLLPLIMLMSTCVHAVTKIGGSTGLTGLAALDSNPHLTVTSLSVTPTSGTAVVGGASNTVGYTATAILSNSQPYDVTGITTWASANGTIASFVSLTATENFQCNTPGSTTITAIFGSVSSTATITCTGTPPPPTLSSIQLNPTTSNKPVGERQGYTATGTYSDGSTQDITATATWSSSNTAVAQVVLPVTSPEGVKCLTGGTTTVTATLGSVSGTASQTCAATLTSITIAPTSASVLIGSVQTYLATCNYSDGTSAGCTLQAAWNSSNTTVATMATPVVSPEPATGLTVGTSNITAVIGSVTSNTAVLTVTSPGPPPPTLSSITVKPANTTVNVGQTQSFTATCTYSDSSTKDCTTSEGTNTTVWTSSSPSVASMGALSNPEIATCVSAGGPVTIQAAVSSKTGSTNLTCATSAATLVSIAITPVGPSLTNGSVIGLTATGTYSDSSTQDLSATATWLSSNTAVATIAGSGAPRNVTCVANSGTSNITAQVGAVTSPADVVTCTTPPTGQGGNLYCTPSGTWVGPTSDSFAAMPTACMNTLLANTPSPGATHAVSCSLSALQTAVNAGACGDIYTVPAGCDLGTGTLVLPHKSCDNAHWNWIHSTGTSDPSFPAEGVRITPCSFNVQTMPNRSYPCATPHNLGVRIAAANASNTVTSPAGGDHWRMTGFQFTRVPTPGAVIFILVDLTATSTQVSNLIFERDWFAGIEGTFPSPSQTTDLSTTRAVWLGQSNHVAIIDSYFTNFFDTSSRSANGNTDAQCVGGGVGGIANSGWGVYKFVNNHCEASGEGFLLGGAGGPARTPSGCTPLVNCNFDAPSDLEVRQNYFFKPPQWNGNTTVPGTTGWPVVKNGWEMKTGVRGLFEGNVVENCWYNAQVCYTFSIAPINQQSGGSPPTPTCPTCVVKDFTYRYNYGYNAAYGVGLYAFAPAGCSSCVGWGGINVSIHDNLIGDNLNLGNLTLQSAGDEMELFATNDPTGLGLTKLSHINISHNSFVKGIRGIAIFGASVPNNSQMNNFTVQNNIWSYGNFGVLAFASTSTACDFPADTSDKLFLILQNCVSTWTWDHNLVFNWVGTLGANWPTNGSGVGNFFTTGSTGVGFTSYSSGNSSFNPVNYQLLTSSPYHNAGSDGKDLGADIPTLINKIQGLRF